MTGIITLTAAGLDTGPFFLYSDVDGFSVPFERDIAKVDLLAPAQLVVDTIPDLTTTVRIKSSNKHCVNFIDIGV